jgi:putative acetyltransferase
MNGLSAALRPYTPIDEDAAIALWLRTWRTAYPDIDFSTRVGWWRARWREELIPRDTIVVAELNKELIGFVTIDPVSGYLDQLVVAPEHWGSGIAGILLARAKGLSPARIELLVNTDNARAIRFYENNGFSIIRTDVNVISGRPAYRMMWRA